MTWLTEKRLNRILAIIFLAVGIVATTNTFRLNAYIRETAPRDAAQEQCNTETIAVMKTWITARTTRDDAMDARDDAAIVVLDKIASGQVATPEELRAWHDAVAADRAARNDAGELRSLLPDC